MISGFRHLPKQKFRGLSLWMERSWLTWPTNWSRETSARHGRGSEIPILSWKNAENRQWFEREITSMFSYLNGDTEPYEAISGVGFPMHNAYFYRGSKRDVYTFTYGGGEIETDLQLILCQAKGLICFIWHLAKIHDRHLFWMDFQDFPSKLKTNRGTSKMADII